MHSTSRTRLLKDSLICSDILSLPIHAASPSSNTEQLRAAIASLEAQPPSRLNTAKLAPLKKELESAKGSNVSSPLLAPKDTSAIPYGGLTAPVNSAPDTQTPTPQNATRSAQEIQGDITSLEDPPPSRFKTAKLAQLKQER